MDRVLPTLQGHDIYSEDGLRDYAKEYQKICKELAMEAQYIAQVLRPALSTLPVNEEPSGVSRLFSSFQGGSAKAYARAVTAYMLRAGEAAVVSAGQMGASWAALERYFLAPPKQQKKPAFSTNRGGNRRRAS